MGKIKRYMEADHDERVKINTDTIMNWKVKHLMTFMVKHEIDSGPILQSIDALTRDLDDALDKKLDNKIKEKQLEMDLGPEDTKIRNKLRNGGD